MPLPFTHPLNLSSPPSPSPTLTLPPLTLGQVKIVVNQHTGGGKTQKEIPDGDGVWRVIDRGSGRDTEVYRGQVTPLGRSLCINPSPCN